VVKTTLVALIVQNAVEKQGVLGPFFEEHRAFCAERAPNDMALRENLKSKLRRASHQRS
jgi:hypothetical protein